MKRNSLRNSLIVGFLGCLLAAPAAALAAGPESGLVIFGDSLSDPGNLFALMPVNNTPPGYDAVDEDTLVPSAAYAVGGHHLTNGPTWVEDLAKSLGLAVNAGPAWRNATSRNTNYAVAGARAYDAGQAFDLSDQVDRFVGSLGDKSAPPDALYVVEIGGNDLRDALVTFLVTLQSTGDPAQAQAAAEALLADSVTSIAHNLETLVGKGAHRFLLWKFPNIGVTPSVKRIATQFPQVPIAVVADSLTQGFNMGVEQVVGQLAASGISVVQLDVHAKVNQMIANGADFGLSNVVDACITPNVAPYKCQQPDEFLFWDGIHPTAAAHAVIAQFAASMLPN